MPATYTFDIFSTLDGRAAANGDWTGVWGKPGPELLARRLEAYGSEQRMVFGAKTYRELVRTLAGSTAAFGLPDPWVARMWELPATVVSATADESSDLGRATVLNADPLDVVSRLKEESEVPLRSHGSLMMNRALMAAGLVDRLQVTIFPVITGRTAGPRIFEAAADFDLELLEHRTLDGHTRELVYRPTLH